MSDRQTIENERRGDDPARPPRRRDPALHLAALDDAQPLDGDVLVAEVRRRALGRALARRRPRTSATRSGRRARQPRCSSSAPRICAAV